jgi:hypothetical protein
MGAEERYRRPIVRRLAAWIVCGPLGHAWAGAADVAAALLEARRARVRRRR